VSSKFTCFLQNCWHTFRIKFAFFFNLCIMNYRRSTRHIFWRYITSVDACAAKSKFSFLIINIRTLLHQLRQLPRSVSKVRWWDIDGLQMRYLTYSDVIFILMICYGDVISWLLIIDVRTWCMATTVYTVIFYLNSRFARDVEDYPRLHTANNGVTRHHVTYCINGNTACDTAGISCIQYMAVFIWE